MILFKFLRFSYSDTIQKGENKMAMNIIQL